ncbi:MAG TPA: hypothetical protein VFB32_09825 [Rudaea sp.]|nr:hypothetical protein [Rudaea sp.]
MTILKGIAGALLLVLLPACAALGEELQPQLIPLPQVVPVDQAFYALVYLHANRHANGFSASSPVLSGNVLSATFDAACYDGPCQPQNDGYWGFYLAIPALAAGTYDIRISGSHDPAPLRFTLGVDGQTPIEPLQQLATSPAQPRAGRAFVADAYFLLPSDRFSWGVAVGTATVSGNTISTPISPIYCPFECPPMPMYGAYRVALPALAPGSYTLAFVDAQAPGTVYARFPLAVANADPAPALGTAGTVALVALMLLAVQVRRRPA